jgi:hypothetical protein
VSLLGALEAAAGALRGEEGAIRAAEGDPLKLLSSLDRDAAARVLGWVLTHLPEDAAALADAWVVDRPGGDPAGARPGVAPKAGRALRAERGNVSARGVKVVEKAPEPMVPRCLGSKTSLRGLVSPIDPSGTRIAYRRAQSSGGARLFEVVIDDRLGVVDCQVIAPGRKRCGSSRAR